MNDPLAIATGTAVTNPLATMPQAAAPLVLAGRPVDLDTGAIVLTEEQGQKAKDALAKLDIRTMPIGQIVTLGAEAEKRLHSTLDGFLAKLDSKSAAEVFKLFGRLKKGVDDAQLDEVLKEVQEVDKRPGFFARLFSGGKSVDDLIAEAFERIQQKLQTKTTTLQAEINKLEQELERECQKLFRELQALDMLKKSYSEHRENFALAAALTHAFLEKSRVEVAAFRAGVQAMPDARKLAELQELEQKLQNLESRALALEGTYTRLPADQMVIAQIQQAGVTTLQETLTTANARFASIKMTLLTLHGAIRVKSTQNMANANAKLDEQLAKARGTLVKDTAATAASAPGDNRLAQAKQIEEIVNLTKEVEAIVAKAQSENKAKFDTARAMFAKARADMGNSPTV